MKIVIALGGNMISDASNKTESFEDQRKRIRTSAGIIADIIEAGHSVVITHGNGPQVGSLLLQQQANVPGSVNLPLNILGALTQGQIGVLLQHSLYNIFRQRSIDLPVVVVPTSVIVDQDDPGFQDPSKPVGPFIPSDEFAKMTQDPSHKFTETGKGFRRIVASPYPRGILEIDQIRQLAESNVVIAGGGGGTPTVRTAEGLVMMDAVIDKDRASAVLASKLGADLLMILTNVEGVFLHFNSDERELISCLTKSQARELIESGEVTKGSMLPKVQAGLDFSGDTIITIPEKAVLALSNKAGTRITNS